MTWSATGNLIQGTSSVFSLIPGQVGQLILIEVIQTSNNTVTASSLISSNVNWTRIAQFSGTTNAYTSSVFAGVATSTSNALVGVTWSGATPAVIWIAGRAFNTTTGNWALDVAGHIDSAGTSTWASLTPAGAGELYWGFAVDSGTAAAGATSGITYEVGSLLSGNGEAFNAAAGAGALAPVWGDAHQLFGVMVFMKEVASSSRNLVSYIAPAGGTDAFSNPFLAGFGAANPFSSQSNNAMCRLPVTGVSTSPPAPVTGTSFANLVTPWLVPAGDAQAATVYTITSWGLGTAGSTQTALTLAINGSIAQMNPPVTFVSASGGFSWRIVAEIVYQSTGSGATADFYMTFTWGTTVATGSGASSGRSGSISASTLAGQTMAIQAKWASAAFAATIGSGDSTITRSGP